MNIFELKIWDDEGQYCTFYTVQWEDSNENETDKFFLQFEDETNEFHYHSNVLLHLILESIGDKYGAIDDFFDRDKNIAQALPPKPKKRISDIEEIGINFPLRLYCYRITESIVVLFNGGIKSAQTDQESSNISLKFYEAQQFAKKINEALKDKTILISNDGRILTNYNGNSEIII